MCESAKGQEKGRWGGRGMEGGCLPDEIDESCECDDVGYHNTIDLTANYDLCKSGESFPATLDG